MKTDRLVLKLANSDLDRMKETLRTLQEVRLSALVRYALAFYASVTDQLMTAPAGRLFTQAPTGGTVYFPLPRAGSYAGRPKRRSQAVVRGLKSIEVLLDKQDVRNLARIETYLGGGTMTLATGLALGLYQDILLETQSGCLPYFQRDDNSLGLLLNVPPHANPSEPLRQNVACQIQIAGAEASLAEQVAELLKRTEELQERLTECQMQMQRHWTFSSYLFHKTTHLSRNLLTSKTKNPEPLLLGTLVEWCRDLGPMLQHWHGLNAEFHTSVWAIVSPNEARLIASNVRPPSAGKRVKAQANSQTITANRLFESVTSPKNTIMAAGNVVVAPIRKSMANHPNRLDMIGFLRVERVQSEGAPPWFGDGRALDEALTNSLLAFADNMFTCLSHEEHATKTGREEFHLRLAQRFAKDSWDAVTEDFHRASPLDHANA